MRELGSCLIVLSSRLGVIVSCSMCFSRVSHPSNHRNMLTNNIWAVVRNSISTDIRFFLFDQKMVQVNVVFKFSQSTTGANYPRSFDSSSSTCNSPVVSFTRSPYSNKKQLGTSLDSVFFLYEATRTSSFRGISFEYAGWFTWLHI